MEEDMLTSSAKRMCLSCCIGRKPAYRRHFQNALSPTERALYAALAPTTQTSTSLKAVARTWEDHLWALVSLSCEERLSVGLSAIERECFWENGLGALETGAAALATEGAEEDVDEEWEHEVMQALESLANVQTAEG